MSRLKAASPQFQGYGTNLSVSAVEMSNLDILFNEEELEGVLESVSLEPSEQLSPKEDLLHWSPLLFWLISDTLCWNDS